MKLLISSMLCLMLLGCSKTEPLVINDTIPIYNPVISPIHTRPVEFTVITDATKHKLADTEVWYGITVDSYENLSYNTQELLRYIRDQKAALNYYRNLENKN